MSPTAVTIGQLTIVSAGDRLEFHTPDARELSIPVGDAKHAARAAEVVAELIARYAVNGKAG